MKGRRKTYIIIGSLLLVGCLISVTVANHSAIADQLRTWKLLPEPDRLTELYFTDHTKLPTSFVPGETQTVSFTIHNLEYRTVPYSYTVVQTDDNGNNPVELARGSVTLQHNETANPSAAVILTDFETKSRLNVVLETGTSGQTIFYNITNKGGGQ